jgi:acyl carrier protein
MPDPIASPVLENVRELLVRVLRVPLTSDDVDVIDMGMLDSLAVVELLVAIEEEFSVQIDLEQLDLADLRTARSIAALVERTRASAVDGGAQAVP